MIIGIHAQNTTRLIVTLTTLVSIGCAAVLIRLAASFLPVAAVQTETEGATAGAPVQLAGVRTAR